MAMLSLLALRARREPTCSGMQPSWPTAHVFEVSTCGFPHVSFPHVFLETLESEYLFLCHATNMSEHKTQSKTATKYQPSYIEVIADEQREPIEGVPIRSWCVCVCDIKIKAWP